MDWYLEHKLIKDGDGYTIEIYLNKDSPEFASEFMSNKKENVLQLNDKINKLVEEKYAKFKINSVKLIIGTLIVATIPFASSLTVAAAAVEPTPTSSGQSVAQTALNTTGIVTVSKLNMRTGPSTTYSIIHVLWQGNQVKVIGESGNWYQIKLSDGRTGWASKSYLQLNQTQQKIDKVISTAKSLIGTPYVWGGKSPGEGGFDCSGLTQYVFKQAGYTLNRISADQAKQGIYVSRNNIKPGDLVFYSFNRDGNISHVGIYIENGQMINSPKTGDTVKVTDITTSYWQDRYVTAHRIIY